MTFNDAKTLFKDRYAQIGLNLEEEQAESLVFSRGKSKWLVDAADLTEYVELEAQFRDFETKPTACSICSKSYCEEALIGIGLPPIDRETEIVFGDPTSNAPFAVFAPASRLFAAYFRLKPDFTEWTCLRLRDTPIARRKTDRIVDRMAAISVIRVERIQAGSIGEAAKIADAIICGCLFQLAAVKGLPHRARRKWPKPRALSQGQVRDEDEEDEGSLPLLTVNPIRDLVSLYTLGRWNSYPQFQFLAFYQVLEYFFIRLADEQLYAKLTRRLNDLAFRCRPEQLDRIIQEVTDHRRESDETEMLKTVLQRYVDEKELISFLQEYEEQTKTSQYSKKRTVFGTDLTISLTPGYVFGTTAKTIKTMRNALVHSSDRYERAERYVPFSAHEDLIAAEIPLMRFLAEKVIIASASPVI